MIIVTAGLIFKEDKILITRRLRGKHGALKWEFPGGKLEEQEDPRLCLVREVREELAIDIQVEKILEVILHRYPERSVLLLFFRCSWAAGEPRAIGCESFEWTAPADLAKFDFLEADLDFIHRIGDYI